MGSEDAGINYILGAGTVPCNQFSSAFLESEAEAHPDLRVLYVPSTVKVNEPICWYRYSNFVFYGSFAELSKCNLKAYVMSL